MVKTDLNPPADLSSPGPGTHFATPPPPKHNKQHRHKRDFVNTKFGVIITYKANTVLEVEASTDNRRCGARLAAPERSACAYVTLPSRVTAAEEWKTT